jgi:hypothetical protein
MTGKVTVPLTISNAVGTRSLFMTWSSADVAGYVYNVQERFKAPSASSFGPWTVWSAPGGGNNWRYRAARIAISANGTYQFSARLENADTAHASG